MKWLTNIECDDPRLGVKIRHIESGNDGDVCIALVTETLLKGVEAPLCIDIGVDMGWWSLFALDTNTTSQVIAFEPNLVSYNVLKAYIEKEPRIALHNLAISDKEGTLPFVIEAGNSNSRDESSSFSVKCTTIDKYLERPVTLMKIDTEGHEIHILQSLRPHMKNIESIIFEFTAYWYTDLKEATDELKRMFTEYTSVYTLNRRGMPSLGKIELKEVDEFIDFCIKNRYQCDILCTRSSRV